MERVNEARIIKFTNDITKNPNGNVRIFLWYLQEVLGFIRNAVITPLLILTLFYCLALKYKLHLKKRCN